MAVKPDEPISAPLGLAYLAASLEQFHHNVTILDAATLGKTERIAPNRWRLGVDETRLAELTRRSRPDLIGVSCPFTTRYGAFRRLIGELRKILPDIPLVAGGIHPTILPEDVLRNNPIDCIVLGEGETTFNQLVENYAATGRLSPESLDGVVWNDGGNPQIRPKTTYIENLDELPIPARHLLDIPGYLGRSGGRWSSRRKTNLSILTSRSCPGRCSFCSIHAVFGPRWRARSPERVVEEVREVHEKYRPNLIAFEDDRLTVDRLRLIQICQGLANLPHPVQWFTPNGVHVADLDDELLRIMRDAGCRSLNLAIESGDQEILRSVIGKKASSEQARQVCEACHKLGVRTNGYFVVGMPGETEDSLERSLDFCLTLPLDGLGVFVATPFPGTRMFDECTAKGYIDPHKILATYYDAADAELLHEPLFETPSMSRERALWWVERFKTEFSAGLYRRRPELRLRDSLKKIHSWIKPQ